MAGGGRTEFNAIIDISGLFSAKKIESSTLTRNNQHHWWSNVTKRRLSAFDRTVQEHEAQRGGMHYYKCRLPKVHRVSRFTNVLGSRPLFYRRDMYQSDILYFLIIHDDSHNGFECLQQILVVSCCFHILA